MIPNPTGVLVVFLHLLLYCRSLAAKYNMPMELAYSLATLALYDIIIFADDSGSMAFEEGGERIQDLKLMVGRVADLATLFDDDGILVRFMNSTNEGNGIRDSMSAGSLISQVRPYSSEYVCFVAFRVIGSHDCSDAASAKPVLHVFLGAAVLSANSHRMLHMLQVQSCIVALQLYALVNLPQRQLP